MMQSSDALKNNQHTGTHTTIAPNVNASTTSYPPGSIKTSSSMAPVQNSVTTASNGATTGPSVNTHPALAPNNNRIPQSAAGLTQALSSMTVSGRPPMESSQPSNIGLNNLVTQPNSVPRMPLPPSLITSVPNGQSLFANKSLESKFTNNSDGSNNNVASHFHGSGQPPNISTKPSSVTNPSNSQHSSSANSFVSDTSFSSSTYTKPPQLPSFPKTSFPDTRPQAAPNTKPISSFNGLPSTALTSGMALNPSSTLPSSTLIQSTNYSPAPASTSMVQSPLAGLPPKSAVTSVSAPIPTSTRPPSFAPPVGQFPNPASNKFGPPTSNNGPSVGPPSNRVSPAFPVNGPPIPRPPFSSITPPLKGNGVGGFALGPPTSGPTPPVSSFAAAPPTSRFVTPPTSGFPVRPPTSKFPAPPTSGFAPPTSGFAPAPPTSGFAPAPPTSGFAPAPPTSGFAPAPPTSGFAPAPPTSGFAPAPPTSGFAPAPPTSGFAPAPPTSGFAPAPPTSGFTPAPPTSGPVPAPPTSGFAPPSTSSGFAPPPSSKPVNYSQPAQQSQRYPQQTQMPAQYGQSSVLREGWNKGWNNENVDLLQQRNILPADAVKPPRPVLVQDFLRNCSPDIFRCTFTKIPETKNILQKAKMPFGILIHPFKDLDQLPVVSCQTIVRCRQCRTYINPFVVFRGEKRWECNLCFRINELPDEFLFDPVSQTYGDPSRRPEVKEATIEYIAPAEYMLRPPQPAVYLWLFDTSRQAVDTGYLQVVCDLLLEQLDHIPGDRRSLIGFMSFSATVQFYLMPEGSNVVEQLEVGDLDDIFVPQPEDLLVSLRDQREQIEDFLTSLPKTHANNTHTQSALGAALMAANKLIGPVGGRITVLTSLLPSIGPGSLQPREDPNQRAAADVNHLNPATDFYKKLALDCSGQQIAVDLFTLNSQYIDLATISGVSKFSGGCIHHFPNFHVHMNPPSVEPFVSCLTRYVTRKIGFEAVMRIRATKGLSITNFHGHFFVRSPDLVSLPNINPDAGFAMQVNIEEPLHNIRNVSFQAAVLYTSSKGERRIRVHTFCLPVTGNVHDVVNTVDQQAAVALLARMAVDRCQTSTSTDARDALINATIDALSSYRNTLNMSTGRALLASTNIRLWPLYAHALLKSVSYSDFLTFRSIISKAS